jgi:hypothetical protein
VTAARGHRVAAGDLIISRRNDPTIDVQKTKGIRVAADSVRNGNRWRVAAVDPATNRIAAQRLTDKARAVFDADYVREDITHGYAVTVHSAQGVTADTAHAVLSEQATRSMLYVGLTRGRDSNTAYLYERVAEHEYGPTQADRLHAMKRGTGRHAARLAHEIIANHDDITVTAHSVTARVPYAALPERIQRLIDRYTAKVSRRLATVQSWQVDAPARSVDGVGGRHHSPSRDTASDYDLEL